MPVDFDPGGPKASVSIGNGVTDKIKFEADDASCMWNDFPVCVTAAELDCPALVTTVQPTFQTTNWTTALTAAVQSPPEATWPVVRVYDYLEHILCGYTLEARIRFTVLSGRGNYAVTNPLTGTWTPGFQDSGVAVVNVDSGWQSANGPDCAQAASLTNAAALTLGLAWTNFNPGIADVIGNGILEARWVLATSTPLADYDPFQTFSIVYNPPCSVDEGLFINLETNSCGALTKTYAQVRTAVNALNLGITASILTGGTDIFVIPSGDGDCVNIPSTDTWCCAMDGAECTGGTYWREGMETP